MSTRISDANQGDHVLDQRRARKAWLTGARALPDPRRKAFAAAAFGQAVAWDPGLADAWLGLHAVGERREEAVAAMASHESRFGEERSRNHLPLASRYMIGNYIDHSLESHVDLWCAVAAGHLDRKEHGLAESALNRTTIGPAPAAFLRGRLAFAQGDAEEAIQQLRQVVGVDKFLEAEGRIISAAALAEVGAMEPARNHLQWVLDQDFLPSAHAEAHYVMGVIARAEDDEVEAMRRFHLAYAERPAMPGLKKAMGTQSSARITINRATAEAGHRSAAEADKDVTGANTVGPMESVEQVLSELDRHVGQAGIKQQMRGLVAQTRAQIARRDAGLPQARLTEHFVFTGPPGTGKTTIARVVARLYKALGILDRGHVVEVDRSSLIGEWHGHTVARTKAVLDKAMGGVLFIDEAYSLQTQGFAQGDPFGQEAIDTLLKRMEDDRDHLVVIAAGYPEPMERFLDSNPGLRSRFTKTIDFAAYAAGDLEEIAVLMATAAGDVLTDEARTQLRLVLDVLDAKGELGSPTFGNARFVRTLVEGAARQRDLRLFAGDSMPTPDVQTLTEITAVDIQAAAGDLA